MGYFFVLCGFLLVLYNSAMVETLKEFFSQLHHLPELIRWGGYTVLSIIVFSETGLLAGFFLPGDSLLVTAGLVCALDGQMKIEVLLFLLSIAAIVGDSTGYLIGKFFGPKIFSKQDSFFFRKSHVEKTHAFYEKHGPKTIILARFVPIIRTFAPTVAGVGNMDYKKFLLYNAVGGILWVFSMTLTGYWLARSIPGIEKKIHYVILIVIFLSILPIIKEIWDAKKKKP